MEGVLNGCLGFDHGFNVNDVTLRQVPLSDFDGFVKIAVGRGYGHVVVGDFHFYLVCYLGHFHTSIVVKGLKSEAVYFISVKEK